MFWLIFTVHILLCVFLIGLVLLQQGKGAEMGPALGAGSSNTLFGASGATSLIVKLTTGACVAFMVTSILLIRYYDSAPVTRGTTDALEGSVLGTLPERVEVPAAPEAETQPAPQAETEAENSGDLAAPAAAPVPPVEETSSEVPAPQG